MGEAKDLGEEIRNLELVPENRQMLVVLRDVATGNVSYISNIPKDKLIINLRQIAGDLEGQ